jgi:uncharacterized membrane protein
MSKLWRRPVVAASRLKSENVPFSYMEKRMKVSLEFLLFYCFALICIAAVILSMRCHTIEKGIESLQSENVKNVDTMLETAKALKEVRDDLNRLIYVVGTARD